MARQVAHEDKRASLLPIAINGDPALCQEVLEKVATTPFLCAE
jgi:hypothetical protein